MAIQTSGSLDVLEPCREGIDDADPVERCPVLIGNGDGIWDQLSLCDVDERRRLGDCYSPVKDRVDRQVIVERLALAGDQAVAQGQATLERLRGLGYIE